MNLVKKNATQAYEFKSERYSFAAVAQYDWGGKITAINSGIVRRNDNGVGSVSFSTSLNGGPASPMAVQSENLLDNLSVQFSGVKQDEQASILSEIRAFVEDIEADIYGTSI